MSRTPMAFLVACLACSSKTQTRSDLPVKRIDVRVVCPTRDEAAMRAYDGAMDAERERNLARAEALYREAVQHDRFPAKN